MTVFTKNNKKILFLHIPKTGGTTIKKTFEENNWNVSWFYAGDNSKVNLSPKGVTRFALAHLYYEKLDEAFDLQNDFDYIFTIVRNPYQRAVSEYNYRRKTGDFTEWFNECTQKALESEMWFNDNHMRLQSDYIGPAIHKIYRFEEGIENILTDIENKLDIQFKSKTRLDNKSHKKLSVEDIDKSIVYDFYRKDFETLQYEK